MDCENKDGGKKVVRSNQKCIFQHGKVAIGNTGYQRKQKEQLYHPDNGCGNNNSENHCPEHSDSAGCTETKMIENIDISCKKQADPCHNQPENRRLLEILTK